MKFAHIAIIKAPGAFDAPLTYGIPEMLKNQVILGQIVRVPLKESFFRGIIVELSDQLTELHQEIKEIEGVIEWAASGEAVSSKAVSGKRLAVSVGQKKSSPLSAPRSPLVNAVHLQLAEKMSKYYHVSLLRCLKLMIPKHLWKGTGKNILKKFNESGILKKKSSPLPALRSPLTNFPLQSLKHELNVDQEGALEEIRKASQPVLLQGVTGSGKTEIYLRLILEAIQQGKQAILLLPEIALTPQMIDYFSASLGEHMAIFHSKLSEGKRLEEWMKVKTGHARLVIGSRSAIFAPVSDLGVLILDEEHEWTYKQESSPYYQAHQVAEMLKELTGCQLILGTATPRLETLHKAKTGEYAHVKLPLRINQQALPKVEIVDLRDEFLKKNYSIFSQLLFNKIKDRLEKKEQVILFVNQRGVARAVVCRDCGTAMMCPHCEVTLKLHNPDSKIAGTLMCHYCSYQTKPVLSCPHCGSVNIRQMGVGTQRVEQDLIKAFPGVRVLRADKDTTSDKLGFKPIYQAFKNHEFDVLVGTQMVAKGHDFPAVTLIGIILADIGLHVPDFRSHERLFHLITQVSGRAGRAERVGEVVLQTYQPDHPAIRMAASYEFEAFAAQELSYREKLHYPPFTQMVKFTVLGRDLEKLKAHLKIEKEILEDIFKVNGLEAYLLLAPAMIPKMGEFYYYHVLIRSANTQLIFDHWKVPKNWRVDVDPVHTS